MNEYKSHKTLNQNIHQLCFSPEGLLFNEFDRIFKDIFSRRSSVYKKIVESLIVKPLTLTEICKALRVEKNGNYQDYLNDLIVAGFLKKNYRFDLQTGESQKISYYKLSDNYLRFYLKYIDRFKTQIQSGQFKNKTLDNLVGFDSFIGYQFENLIFNNTEKILNLLEISQDSIVSIGSYTQKKSSRNARDVQIDLLIHAKPNTLYVCEIKFQKRLSNEVAKQIVQKIKLCIE